MSAEPYSNIREMLGCYVGRTIIDISQHERDEFNPEEAAVGLSGGAFVQLLFNDASWIRFFIGDDGFVTHCEPPDCPLHPEES